MKLFIAIFYLLCLANYTKACSCLEIDSIQNFEVVVTGKILSQTKVTYTNLLKFRRNEKGDLLDFYSPEQNQFYAYQLKIEKIYKGNFTQDTITVFSGEGGGDCGFMFSVGKNYLIAGTYNNNWGLVNSARNPIESENCIWTNECRPTTLLNETELNNLEKLLKGIPAIECKYYHKFNVKTEPTYEKISLENYLTKKIKEIKISPLPAIFKFYIDSTGKVYFTDMNSLQFYFKEGVDNSFEQKLKELVKNIECNPAMLYNSPVETNIEIIVE